MTTEPTIDGGSASRADALWRLVEDLFPLRRSLTGAGVRATLERVGAELPIAVHEVASGTDVLDWVVPPEWVVHGARVVGPDGSVVVDAADHPLHLVGYSRPFSGRLDRAELDAHLHSLPDRPGTIPYRTSYYNDGWGFCVSHEVRAGLVEGDYEVVVDTELLAGSLSYGELVIPGASDDEVLLSTHICHPGLANDNCSGIAVLVELGRHLAASPRRLTYRLVFAPGTIGAITWLATHPDEVTRIRHGFVLTGLGDGGRLHYKRSRRGDTGTDRAAEIVLRDRGRGDAVIDFSPYGYDERQYCSPGYDLAVGRLTRSLHGEFPEYHTSDDDLSFVTAAQMLDAVDALEAMVEVLETDGRFVNRAPHGEPQLGRRGLYRAIGSVMDRGSVEMALLWVLSASDGTATLTDIAQRSGLPYRAVLDAARALRDADLLAEATG
jgi:aminopeptidase-like protein